MLDAVIFDMDGVLIDSEGFWREAERARFAEVGLQLDEDELLATMGLRVDEVVAYWAARRPWSDPDHAGLARRIAETVAQLVTEQGAPLPGVRDALRACEERGLALAVASSSPWLIIDTVLGRLDLTGLFDAVCSAETEPYGKPHPGVLLTTAARLGVDPTRCLVVEDSVNGMIAALAARMRCVVVPEHPDRRFVLAEHVLESLDDFPAVLAAIDAAPGAPGSAGSPSDATRP